MHRFKKIGHPAHDKPENPKVPEKILHSFVTSVGNPRRGAKIFRQRCAGCHSTVESKGHKTGPNLWNIYMSLAGRHTSTFSYSMNNRMNPTGVVWTHEQLMKYFKNPRKTFPGTIMVFSGVKKEEDRRDIASYLMTRHERYVRPTS